MVPCPRCSRAAGRTRHARSEEIRSYGAPEGKRLTSTAAIIAATIWSNSLIDRHDGKNVSSLAELARAQGFTDYISDRGADGERVGAEDVVKMIGNSGCPQMGEAFGRLLAELLRAPSQDRPPRWWSKRQGRAGLGRAAA